MLTFLCSILLPQIILGSQWDVKAINNLFCKKICCLSVQEALPSCSYIRKNGKKQWSLLFLSCVSVMILLLCFLPNMAHYFFIWQCVQFWFYIVLFPHKWCYMTNFPPAIHLHPCPCPHVFFWRWGISRLPWVLQVTRMSYPVSHLFGGCLSSFSHKCHFSNS